MYLVWNKHWKDYAFTLLAKKIFQSIYQNDDLQEAHETRFAKHLTALMIYLQLFPGQNLNKKFKVIFHSKIQKKGFPKSYFSEATLPFLTHTTYPFFHSLDICACFIQKNMYAPACKQG